MTAKKTTAHNRKTVDQQSKGEQTMKKMILGLMVVAMASAILMTGCSKPKQPETTQTSAAGTTYTAEVEVKISTTQAPQQ